mmetsp:Transcript_28860/g.52735  ORF Transcript_28860/g.52735 Transcript_28860/m.52735 type:complete len:81 (+) Transcript_28860:26-268(+)
MIPSLCAQQCLRQLLVIIPGMTAHHTAIRCGLAAGVALFIRRLRNKECTSYIQASRVVGKRKVGRPQAKTSASAVAVSYF